LGGNLHISQGIEIHEWHADADKVQVSFKLNRKGSGNIYLYLPGRPGNAFIKEKSMSLLSKGPGMYTINLENADGAKLRIER
jgi:hypothetical protein